MSGVGGRLVDGSAQIGGPTVRPYILICPREECLWIVEYTIVANAMLSKVLFVNCQRVRKQDEAKTAKRARKLGESLFGRSRKQPI